MAGNGSEHDDFEEPTEPSFTVPSPDPVAPALRPAMAIGARVPKPSPSPAPSSTTSQSMRVVPATSVPPTSSSPASPSAPSSTTSQTVSNPRRGGGLVVHRATQPAMRAMPSSISPSSSSSTGSFPAISPEVTDPRGRPPTGSMPIVSSEMQEALAGLKPVRRASSTTSTSLPAISAPPGTKAEVSEALAALKPAAPSVDASRLPPRPTTSVGFDGPPTDPGTPSTKPPRARFEIPVSGAAFKRGAWGVVVAATVAAIVVLIPRDVVAPPVVVDLPVVVVPPGGLPCEQLTSRRTHLACHLRRTVYFELSPTERLQRLDVTRVAALNGHFEELQLIDVGGTWHRLPTQPTTAPTPARVGVEIVDVPAEVPVTAAKPKLLPAKAAGSKPATSTATKAKAP